MKCDASLHTGKAPPGSVSQVKRYSARTLTLGILLGRICLNREAHDILSLSCRNFPPLHSYSPCLYSKQLHSLEMALRIHFKEFLLQAANVQLRLLQRAW